jgi:hypothetical protein
MMKHVTCVVENEIPGYRGRLDEIANKAQGISFPMVDRAPSLYIKNARL